MFPSSCKDDPGSTFEQKLCFNIDVEIKMIMIFMTRFNNKKKPLKL